MDMQVDSNSSIWVREYRCINPDCLDGVVTIRVNHTVDTKIHMCAWCGEQCNYERDVKCIQLNNSVKT